MKGDCAQNHSFNGFETTEDSTIPAYWPTCFLPLFMTAAAAAFDGAVPAVDE
jgi:hypothetical protein